MNCSVMHIVAGRGIKLSESSRYKCLFSGMIDEAINASHLSQALLTGLCQLAARRWPMQTTIAVAVASNFAEPTASHRHRL
jgi:hypothetical protein